MSPERICLSALVLIVALLYRAFYHVPAKFLTFTPERIETCARLHNELIAKVVSKKGNASISRDIAERFLHKGNEISAEMDMWFDFGMPRRHGRMYPGEPELPPNQPAYFDFKDSPGYQFLSKIDTYQLEGEHDVVFLSPDAEQPQPGTMYLDPRYYPATTCIKLYSGAAAQHYESGIILDMYSGLAHWDVEWFIGGSTQDSWHPLESILQTWSRLYEEEKYYFNPHYGTPEIRPWTKHDLAESLRAWDSLLDAITSRISGEKPSAVQFEPGLDQALLSKYSLSPFAMAFLSKARRPSFKFVAPGITTFTPESFEKLYSSEPSTSGRLKRYVLTEDNVPDAWPSLVLPAEQTIGHFTADKSFSGDWIVEGFAINRRAGLYTGGDPRYSDVVHLVDHKGRTSSFQMSPLICPWGPSRSPRLAEVLNKWEELVRGKKWHVVDKYGVTNVPGWFDEYQDQTTLKWPVSGS